jgi:hypothetical protein
MRKISWRELPNNKYLKKLESEMLLPKGFTAMQRVVVVGQKKSEIPQKIAVHYDRDYVMHKLVNDVILPLRIVTFGELEALIIELWSEIHDCDRAC